VLQVSGVVFTVACEPYLESEYGNEWVGEAPIKLLDKLSEMPGQAGEEVVVVGQVLADEATLGYEDVSNMRVSAWILLQVNGVESGRHWLCSLCRCVVFAVFGGREGR
jgi:hypothetical protein